MTSLDAQPLAPRMADPWRSVCSGPAWGSSNGASLTHRCQNPTRAGSPELVLVPPGHPFRHVIEEARAHPTLSPLSAQSRSALNSTKGREQTPIDVARRPPVRDTLDMKAVSSRCDRAGDEFIEYECHRGRSRDRVSPAQAAEGCDSSLESEVDHPGATLWAREGTPTQKLFPFLNETPSACAGGLNMSGRVRKRGARISADSADASAAMVASRDSPSSSARIRHGGHTDHEQRREPARDWQIGSEQPRPVRIECRMTVPVTRGRHEVPEARRRGASDTESRRHLIECVKGRG